MSEINCFVIEVIFRCLGVFNIFITEQRNDAL
jgi:hypothetical protein